MTLNLHTIPSWRIRHVALLSFLVAFGMLWVPACSQLSQGSKAEETSEADKAEGKSDANPDDTVELPEIAHGETAVVRKWVGIEDFRTDLAVFQTVFWEPLDTPSLRQLLRTTPLVEGKSVMEIGTGSGLVSLCCLKANASKVVATDVNISAVANAEYNAKRFGYDDRFEVRRVALDNSGAFTIIKDSEKFDYIISNPPWEDDVPKSIDEYALYDPGFKLLDSLLVDCRAHLNPGGKIYLAYGCVTAIKVIFQLADKYDLQYRVLDDRTLDDLPEVFLPGMLIELTPKEFLTASDNETEEKSTTQGRAESSSESRTENDGKRPQDAQESSDTESHSATESPTDN